MGNVINEFDSASVNEPNQMDEAPEEVMEEDGDYTGLEDYTVFAKMGIKTPRTKGIVRRSFECVFPLSRFDDQPMRVPGFADMFSLDGFDGIREEATLAIKIGEDQEIVPLQLNVTKRYQKSGELPNDGPVSICAELTLRKIRFINRSMPGRLIFSASDVKMGRFMDQKTVEKEHAMFRDIDIDRNDCAALRESGWYFVTSLVNEEKDLVVMMVHEDEGTPDVENSFYVAISKDRPIQEIDIESVDDNGGHSIERISMALALD